MGEVGRIKKDKSGFFKGKVSEADINFSLEIYYVVDVYTTCSIVYAGSCYYCYCMLKATPVVLANIQGLYTMLKHLVWLKVLRCINIW